MCVTAYSLIFLLLIFYDHVIFLATVSTLSYTSYIRLVSFAAMNLVMFDVLHFAPCGIPATGLPDRFLSPRINIWTGIYRDYYRGNDYRVASITIFTRPMLYLKIFLIKLIYVHEG